VCVAPFNFFSFSFIFFSFLFHFFQLCVSKPNLHASISAYAPLSKELVFDIDLTDYNDIRRCCSGVEICSKCWPLMTAAIKVIYDILSTDFGYQHILVVFSGRRGVHFWIADPKAKALSQDARSAIVDYLTVYMGKNGNALTGGIKFHPTLDRSYQILKPYFGNMCTDQGWLENLDTKSESKILKFFDPAVREEFHFLAEGAISLSTWEKIEDKVEQLQIKLRKEKFKNYSLVSSLQTVLPRIVFAHIYPRLDVNVSKQLNHLLKAPFCIHPKTGKVCVPIDPEKVDDFDPEKVPVSTSVDHAYTDIYIYRYIYTDIYIDCHQVSQNRNIFAGKQ
jgi:DNA primase small subunit